MVTAGLWTVTRSWFIIGRLTPEMERKLGGRVLIAEATYQGNGRVVFTNMRLRAPGLPGRAGEVVSIGRAVVNIDMKSLLSGSVKVTEIELEEAVLRVSEDVHQSGRVNFKFLRPDWSDTGGKRTAPPRVLIRNAALEFGSHDGRRYDMRGRRLVSGEMYPALGGDEWYVFVLREEDENGEVIAPNGIFIRGQWNAATNEHHSRIDGLELDERIYKMLPQKARVLWDRMDLQGKVDAITMDWKRDQPFSVEFAVKNVDLTLPIEAGQLWARYKEGQSTPIATRPRMHVSSGTIRLDSDSLELRELTGELGGADANAYLVGVPYNISFTMSSLPPVDWENREQWMEQVLKTAPFDLKFRVDEFSLTRNEVGEAPAIDLPAIVTKVLSKFQVTDWVLSTTVQMTRAAPTTDEHGRLESAKAFTNGQAYIRKASGRYQKFPYKLDDVDAYLQFDNEKVLVHYLTGRGSGNSQFRISGVIAPPENNSSVSLRLTGTDVPVDDRLRSALKDSELEAFETMFHRPSNESLAAAGLLPDEAVLESARRERAAAADQLNQIKHDSTPDDPQQTDAINMLQGRMTRLQRSIDAGPFQLGGTVNLDLAIERPLGPKQRTSTTGTIVIQSVGLLYEKFPYPLRITGRALDWQKDRVVIVPAANGEGVSFVAPGGGVGTATGELVFHKVDAQRKVQPDLKINVVDDEITPSIYAAIPLTKSERITLEGAGKNVPWPGGVLSKAARLVQGIGLSGPCTYDGRIHTSQDGHFAYDFALSLKDGTARPNVQLVETLGATDEPWPPGFTLGQVQGSMDISRERIQWNNVTGQAGLTTIVANGTLDLRNEQAGSTIKIDGQTLPLERYILNLIPPDHAAQATAIWERYQPQGTFDGTLEYEAVDGVVTRRFDVTPRMISLLCGGERVAARAIEGEMTITGKHIAFNNLDLQLAGEDHHPEGAVTLNGSYSLQDAAKGLNLTGTWKNGHLESPLVVEALKSSRGGQAEQWHQQYQPAGEFDADFSIHSRPGDQPTQYELALRPRSVGLLLGETRFNAEIDQGQVSIMPGQIGIHEIAGRHSGGEFTLDGAVTTTSPLQTRLSLGYLGQLRSPQVEAWIPTVAREALESIKLSDGNSPARADFELRLTQNDQAQSMPEQPKWGVDLRGRVHMQGASLRAGVLFSDVDGTFDLDIQHVPGSAPSMNLLVRAESAVTMGQTLRNIEAPLVLSPEDHVIRIPSFRADAQKGVISAQASVGVGENREYETTIEMVGVPIEGFLKLRHAGHSASTVPVSSPRSQPQGEMFASASISGLRDQPETRRGRAVLRVLHGRMANVPLALQVVQMMQLTLPFHDNLDYANADMYLAGDRVVFEEILFESTVGRMAPLQLTGRGEMNLETLELDLRFQSRSGVAILREIIGRLGDRLYGIQVTGPLGNPRARVVPLPAMN